MGVRLRMFKLRFWDGHVHAVAATGVDGEHFDGPGVDLRGERAREAFDAAVPMLERLAELEPGIRVRSLSLNLERRRLLATLEPTTPETDPRYRVVRLDEGAVLDRVLDAAAPVITLLGERVADALQRRGHMETGDPGGASGGSV